MQNQLRLITASYRYGSAIHLIAINWVFTGTTQSSDYSKLGFRHPRKKHCRLFLPTSWGPPSNLKSIITLTGQLWRNFFLAHKPHKKKINMTDQKSTKNQTENRQKTRQTQKLDSMGWVVEVLRFKQAGNGLGQSLWSEVMGLSCANFIFLCLFRTLILRATCFSHFPKLF